MPFQVQALRPFPKCYGCSREPVSVCSFEEDEVVGCGEAFCKSHGIAHDAYSLHQEALVVNPPKVEQFSEKDRRIHEELRKSLGKVLSIESSNRLRMCHACLDKLGEPPRPELKRFGWLLALLILALLAIFFVFVTSGEACAYCREQAERVRIGASLGQKELAAWAMFKAPEAELCYFDIARQKSYSNKKYELFCRCKDLVLHYNATAGRCQKVDCPPSSNQILLITSVGGRLEPTCTQFTQTLETFTDPTTNATCPIRTKYNSFYEACEKVSICPRGFKITNEGQCLKCPPYSSVTMSKGTCGLIPRSGPDKIMDFDVWNWGGRKCPATPVAATEIEKSERGYIAQFVDELGYLQCPATTNRTMEQNAGRICEPQEMILMRWIGCRSPCKRCSEQWNFGLKLCQPADDCTGLKNHFQTVNGHCVKKQISKEIARGLFCE